MQLVLQLRYKVVAGDEKLKLSAFQLAILALQQNQTGICCCLPGVCFVVKFHAFNDESFSPMMKGMWNNEFVANRQYKKRDGYVLHTFEIAMYRHLSQRW